MPSSGWSHFRTAKPVPTFAENALIRAAPEIADVFVGIASQIEPGGAIMGGVDNEQAIIAIENVAELIAQHGGRGRLAHQFRSDAVHPILPAET